MPKTGEYKIVNIWEGQPTWQEMERRVNALMEEGWVPTGGPVKNPNGKNLVQAMVKLND